MRAAGDDHSAAAYWLGRGAVAVVALVLLGLSLLLLWNPAAGALSLVGAMVATTPMSLWSFSVLNTSGLEIAGAICWTAGLVRLARGSPSPPWVWAATAAGGVVLATARPSGTVFVLFAPLCVALVLGLAEPVAAVRRGSTRAVVATLVVGVAIAAALFWQRYMPGYSLGLDTARDSVWPALEGLPEALREAVGRFAGDYFVPTWVAVAWAFLLAVLVAAAARRQPRLALVAVVSFVAIAAYATSYLTSGFDAFYGRYALPALVVLPLCAGVALADRGSQLAESARARLVVAFTLATAADPPGGLVARGETPGRGSEWPPPLPRRRCVDAPRWLGALGRRDGDRRGALRERGADADGYSFSAFFTADSSSSTLKAPSIRAATLPCLSIVNTQGSEGRWNALT